jgi:hypothetical protein
VVAVAADRGHRFSKPPQDEIVLVEGYGVEGDAHAGPFVRHRDPARRQPRLANLRQVHLIPSELFAFLSDAGLEVRPGELGENITTAGVDLERMPLGTLIELGPTVIVELTAPGRPVSYRPFPGRLEAAGAVVGENRPSVQMRDAGRGQGRRSGCGWR